MRGIHMKTLRGRGRKRPAWKEVLFTVILDEFNILRSAGVKMTRILVQEMAIGLLNDQNVLVSAQEIEQVIGRAVYDDFNLSWVQSFLDTHKIITRMRTGNKTHSAEKEG